MMMIFGIVPFIILVLIALNLFSNKSRWRIPGLHRTRRLSTEDDDRENLNTLSTTVHGFDSRIFSLARRYDGRLSVSDIIIETGMNMAQTEKYMDSLVDGTHVALDVEDSGRLVYLFPEIIAKTEM